MKKRHIMLTVMLLVALPRVGARAGQVVDAVRLDALPPIDGHIDYAVWGHDGWHGDLRSIRDLAVVRPAIETRFKLGYTATHLVVAMRCALPGVDIMPAATTRPGGSVWGDEGVEIFVAPHGPDGTYYQIGINAWGTATTLSQPGNSRWSPDMPIGTSRDPEGWSLELAIPFAAMDVPAPAPADGDVISRYEQRTLGADGELLAFAYRERDAETGANLAWGFNLGRNSSGNWSFSPFRGGYHQPTKFAAVSFAGAAAWSMALEPDTARLVRKDRFHFEQVVTYRNPTDEAQNVVLHAAFEDTHADVKIPARIDPGQAHAFTIDLPLERMGETVMALALDATQDDGSRLPLRVDRLSRTFRELPIAVTFRLPYRRDVLYASQPVDTLHARIKLQTAEADELGRTVIVNLHDVEGHELAAQPVELNALTQDIALPIPPLEPGRYRLTAWSEPEGFTFFQQSIVIDLLPRAANEWILTTDGGLSHNGHPFQPRGFISGLDSTSHIRSTEHLQRLAEAHGANVHIAAGLCGLDDDALEAMLDRHLAAGLFAVLPPAPMAADRMAESLDEAEAAAIQSRVRRLRNHDALLGWLIAYTPSDRIGVRERIAQAAAVVYETDPYRPLISVHDSIPAFRGFSSIGDIRLLAPPLAGRDARDAETILQTWLTAIAETDTRPLWVSAGLPRESADDEPPAERWHRVAPAAAAGAGGLFVPLAQ